MPITTKLQLVHHYSYLHGCNVTQATSLSHVCKHDNSIRNKLHCCVQAVATLPLCLDMKIHKIRESLGVSLSFHMRTCPLDLYLFIEQKHYQNYWGRRLPLLMWQCPWSQHATQLSLVFGLRYRIKQAMFLWPLLDRYQSWVSPIDNVHSLKIFLYKV